MGQNLISEEQDAILRRLRGMRTNSQSLFRVQTNGNTNVNNQCLDG